LHQHLAASNRAILTILMTAYPDERTPFAAEELLACARRALKRHDVGGV
jgi:hypothetical protein